MRRMSIFAAAIIGLGLASQASCQAGSCGRGNCGPACNPLQTVIDKGGFSYFQNICCQPCCKGGSKCPPYVNPNRAPRDFWMLR